MIPDDPDVPKLKLKAVVVGKKKRSSTESGSSSESAMETVAARLKRTRRTVVPAAAGGSGLDPILEENPKKGGALDVIPEPVFPPAWLT